MPPPNHSITMAHHLNFPFELRGGGNGVALLGSTTPGAAQALGMKNGEQITVCNDGTYCLWFVIGDANILATLGCTPVLPGTKEVFTVPNDGGTYTHISAIARIGTVQGTANFGFGS